MKSDSVVQNSACYINYLQNYCVKYLPGESDEQV